MAYTTTKLNSKNQLVPIIIHLILNEHIPMDPTHLTNNRDPVCGMSVDPATTRYSYDHRGTTWLFCSDGCRQAFAENPAAFVASSSETDLSSTQRPLQARPVLVAIGIFIALVLVITMARGITTKPTDSRATSTVVGAPAGQHQAVDNGANGVIVSAEHDQADDGLAFTVSLNTHAVPLDNFDPAVQVKLHAGRSISTPTSVSRAGDTSSHHQNYRLTFSQPGGDSSVLLSFHDVAGVSERQLPFNL
ncbi:MAG: YHS domain-containing protein [Candidatus Kerfeldbacteria bacterium]|nr:YHS domain-containing protein [Candidatus Kerfeldbacteria bacterium]